MSKLEPTDNVLQESRLDIYFYANSNHNKKLTHQGCTATKRAPNAAHMSTVASQSPHHNQAVTAAAKVWVMTPSPATGLGNDTLLRRWFGL